LDLKQCLLTLNWEPFKRTANEGQIFVDIDMDEMRNFALSIGVSVFPSYHFFIQGHRIATLEIPEPEHLEALITIPFNACN
jgi:hypothetical protein